MNAKISVSVSNLCWNDHIFVIYNLHDCTFKFNCVRFWMKWNHGWNEIWMKQWLKTRSEESASANIFLELPLTNSHIIFEWMQYHNTDHTLTFIHWLTVHLTLLTLTIMTLPLEQNSEAATGDVLKNLSNFTGKRLCWSLIFTMLQAFGPATLLKDSCIGVFLWNLRNFKNTYFEEHLWTTAPAYL